MKHAVIGLTFAALAASSFGAWAQDAQTSGAPAGNVDKASTFANGNVGTIIAIGVGAATALAVAVIGVSDDNGSNSTATATATATTR